ncbi:MAG: hypothetical protein OXG30_12145, partial [bacterium]|nr:hypothetical protein [bacterium]
AGGCPRGRVHRYRGRQPPFVRDQGRRHRRMLGLGLYDEPSRRRLLGVLELISVAKPDPGGVERKGIGVREIHITGSAGSPPKARYS